MFINQSECLQCLHHVMSPFLCNARVPFPVLRRVNFATRSQRKGKLLHVSKRKCCGTFKIKLYFVFKVTIPGKLTQWRTLVSIFPMDSKSLILEVQKHKTICDTNMHLSRTNHSSVSSWGGGWTRDAIETINVNWLMVVRRTPTQGKGDALQTNQLKSGVRLS